MLPDGYEVQDASMSDIKVTPPTLGLSHQNQLLSPFKHVIRPLFTKDEIQQLDKVAQVSYDLHHKRYLAGFVGLNNIKANDYVNTIVHVLCHVQPLRDYFLSNEKLDAPELGN